jgi:hypothetical protein
MEVIPLDASLVKGSHGRLPARPGDGAMVMTNQKDLLTARSVEPTAVMDVVLRHLSC